MVSRAISSTAQNKGLQTFPIRLISAADWGVGYAYFSERNLW